MNIPDALRILQPEHARLSAKLAAHPKRQMSRSELAKLDRMNAVIRAACIRQAGLEAVRKELDTSNNGVY